MKSTLFILIGYITCTFKCEIIEGAAEENTEDLEKTPVVDTTGAGESPDNIMQTNMTIITSPFDTTEAGEHPDSIIQQKVTIITPAVDTTSSGGPPENFMQSDATIIIPAVDTTGVGEQPDGIMPPNVTIITPADDTTSTGDPPENITEPEVTIITSPVDYTGDGEQSDSIIKPKVTKEHEIQANDTGPAKIKVEDALKILHKSKKIYASESVALIKKLEWLRTISNITEIEIEHKIDPKSFDYLSDTEISLKSSSIYRRDGLKQDPDFILLKKAILKERGKSIKFKRFPRSK